MRLVLVLFFIMQSASSVFAQDAREIVVKAINHWRGTSSQAEAEMTIHRPDWQREMAMVSITKGTERSLVRFTAPPKDAGSATLSLGDETWSYAPKVNRIIKIPPSMKAQSWMGSDFSYRDLTKSDDIIDQYNHTLLKSEVIDGQRHFTIESIPAETAPVVWGKEILTIREDNIILKHDFYDQAGELVKVLEARDIAMLDGKIYPKVIRISKVEDPDEWTEIRHNSIRFGVDLPDSAFTLSALRSSR